MLTAAQARARIRRICLALPDATEKVAWGSPTFRVRDRIFVMVVNDHHGDGRLAIWCNADRDAQVAIVEADPRRFFVPPSASGTRTVSVSRFHRPKGRPEVG